MSFPLIQALLLIFFFLIHSLHLSEKLVLGVFLIVSWVCPLFTPLPFHQRAGHPLETSAPWGHVSAFMFLFLSLVSIIAGCSVDIYWMNAGLSTIHFETPFALSLPWVACWSIHSINIFDHRLCALGIYECTRHSNFPPEGHGLVGRRACKQKWLCSGSIMKRNMSWSI